MSPPIVEACSALSAEYGDTVCEICQERIYAPEMIDVCPHYCKHLFCGMCMHKVKMMSSAPDCPFCRCKMPWHHHHVRPPAGTAHRKTSASNAKRLVQLLLSMDDSRRWCCAAPSVGAICREEGLCNPVMTLAEAKVHNAAGAVCMRDRVKCPHRYCTYTGSVHEIATIHAPFCSLIAYTACEEELCSVGVNPLLPREVHNEVCMGFHVSCLVSGCDGLVPRCLMHEHLNTHHAEELHATVLHHEESFKMNPEVNLQDTHDRYIAEFAIMPTAAKRVLRAICYVNRKVHVEILLMVFNYDAGGIHSQQNVKVAPMVIHWPTFGTQQALRGTDTVTITAGGNPSRSFAVDQITKFKKSHPQRNECLKIGQYDRIDGLVRFKVKVVASKVEAGRGF